MKIDEIRARLLVATPSPWVWGSWTIFEEDRPAQKRGEPYWTVTEPNGYAQCLARGPLGRKTAKWPDNILYGQGDGESDIDVKPEDAAFIANAPRDVADLLGLLDTAIETLKKFSNHVPRAEAGVLERAVNEAYAKESLETLIKMGLE